MIQLPKEGRFSYPLHNNLLADKSLPLFSPVQFPFTIYPISKYRPIEWRAIKLTAGVSRPISGLSSLSAGGQQTLCGLNRRSTDCLSVITNVSTTAECKRQSHHHHLHFHSIPLPARFHLTSRPSSWPRASAKPLAQSQLQGRLL